MNALSSPRGRHPAQVYWVRRAAVLATALLLVVAFARLLGGSGGGGTPDAAGPVASHSTSAAPTSVAPGLIGPVGVTTSQPAGQPTGQAPRVPLAQPDGPCEAQDITVTPKIAAAPAGGLVLIDMELTGIKPACTFTVSSETLAVRITRKGLRVWTSQQCPSAITTRELVVRSAVPIPIKVRWSGRKSDDQCSRSAGWALPGNYDVIAAVIGSEPTEKRFALVSPPRPVVTKTITAKPTPTAKASPTGKVD